LLERFLISIIAMAGAQAGAVRVLTDDGQSMRLVGQVGLPPPVVHPSDWSTVTVACAALPSAMMCWVG
jgi:two-component system nitrate/nitrite sensor histidine kinase NarX